MLDVYNLVEVYELHSLTQVIYVITGFFIKQEIVNNHHGLIHLIVTWQSFRLDPQFLLCPAVLFQP